MKIMKVFDKKIGDKEYFKYRLPLPKKVAEDSGLINKELKVTTKGRKIVVEEDNGQG